MMGEVSQNVKSRNVSHLNIPVHDVINLLHYEYWTDKQKYLYGHQQTIEKWDHQMRATQYDNEGLKVSSQLSLQARIKAIV